MKPFILESSMTTVRGVFYPTGYAVLMFPDKDAARLADKAIVAAGIGEDEITVLPPEAILGDIAETVRGTDDPFPSVGTEARTVREMMRLAEQGHWGLMVHVPHQDDGERMMAAVKGMPVSYAQKYRHLVIEDL